MVVQRYAMALAGYATMMMTVPASEQGMGSTLTADSPAVGPWTLTPPAPSQIVEWSGNLSGVVRKSMSGEL